MRRQTHVFLARSGERLIRAVAVAGIGRIGARQQQLEGGAREIVFELVRDQRAAARLAVHLEQLRRRAGAEHVAHPDRPKLSANAR